MLEILHKANWGDVPTWGAMVFAVAAVIVGYRVYRIEHERDERTDADRRARANEERQAQAALVSAWPGSTTFHAIPIDPYPTTAWGAYIRNASQLPVYTVKIVFWYQHPQSSEREERASIIRPLVEPSTEPLFVTRPEELRKPSSTDERGYPVFTEAINQFVVSLEFTDTAGRRWRRDVDGSLHQLTAQAGGASP